MQYLLLEINYKNNNKRVDVEIYFNMLFIIDKLNETKL